jgi:hypothetical protein
VSRHDRLVEQTPTAQKEAPMEALTILFIIVTVLILLGTAAAIGGVDSRDGFAGDHLRPNFS